MRPREEILKDIRDSQNVIDCENKKISHFLQELKSLSEDEWDWVSVKKGAEILDISIQILYRKINAGLLTTRHIGSKTYIQVSELKKIDDKDEKMAV